MMITGVILIIVGFTIAFNDGSTIVTGASLDGTTYLSNGTSLPIKTNI